MPGNELHLVYAPVAWGIGYALGWTIAWIAGKSAWGDYDGCQAFLTFRTAAVSFWLYVLVWFFGTIEI